MTSFSSLRLVHVQRRSAHYLMGSNTGQQRQFHSDGGEPTCMEQSGDGVSPFWRKSYDAKQRLAIQLVFRHRRRSAARTDGRPCAIGSVLVPPRDRQMTEIGRRSWWEKGL